MTFLIISILSLYKKAISPFLGFRCRYIPSCSEYAMEAVRAEGPLKGLWRAAGRIVRCAPWGGKGLDLYEKKP